MYKLDSSLPPPSREKCYEPQKKIFYKVQATLDIWIHYSSQCFYVRFFGSFYGKKGC